MSSENASTNTNKKASTKAPVERDDKGIPIHARNDKGSPICGHKNRRHRENSNERCQNTQRLANGRCKKHQYGYHLLPNGKLTRDMGKHLPPTLERVFLESYSREDQLSMRHEIALTDANQMRLLEQLSLSPDIASWERLSTLAYQLGEALEQEDIDALNHIHTAFTNLCTQGSRVPIVWDAVQGNALVRAKLTDTEGKRLNAARTVLNANDAESLILSLFEILTKHVRDLATLRAIQTDSIALLSLPEKIVRTTATPHDTDTTHTSMPPHSHVTIDVSPDADITEDIDTHAATNDDQHRSE